MFFNSNQDSARCRRTALASRCRSIGFSLAFALAGFAPGISEAQNLYGALSNFDVFNDTGHDCHGFEIELEDASSRDVGYTFGAPYERYGDPQIVDFTTPDGRPGVRIRYVSAYDSATGSFVATTPQAPQPITATDGHSCFNGSGIGDYNTSGCEHFGISLSINPSKTTYRWLVADPNVPGALQPLGTNVSIPAVTWAVQPPPVVGQPPVVQAVIAAEPPQFKEFGEAMWVKVYKTELPEDVELDNLLTDDPVIPDGSDPVEVETEWYLLQARIGGGAEDELLEEAQLGAGNKSVVRRYEFYKYIGTYDPENNEANCDNPDGVKADCQIPGGVVGDYIGSQMAAANLDPSFTINSLLPDTEAVNLPVGSVGVQYPERPLVLGGTQPYTLQITGGALPDGLSLDLVTGIVSGIPTTTGAFSFTIEAMDANGVVIHGTFNVSVTESDLCLDDPAKTTPGICGCGLADTDGDGDGIADCVDECPADSSKDNPGVCGCGVSEVDSDNDGTANCLDQCVSDAAKVAPGACGCGVSDADVDGDGNPDCLDQCPADPLKSAPGICGCGVSDADTDGDGTANCVDQCATDATKVAPGVCGCGVADADSDGDGTANCNDQCPSDGTKLSPGTCGCGVSDADTDGDGTPNCIDQCATDSTKVAPGICGCGVSDADSDGDGTADCVDQCASDATKVAPGTCGCGVSDADSDGDGTPNCVDQCGADPTKVAPGICGCGIADVDTDGDGNADCLDLCPSDSTKVAPGICGCGVSDADTDGDGTANCLDQCVSDATKVAPGVCGCGVPDVDANGNGTIDCTETTVKADLGIDVTGILRTARAGIPFPFIMTVRNYGPEKATKVVARAHISGVPLKGFIVPRACKRTGNDIECTWSSIGANRLQLTAVEMIPTKSGTLTIETSVSSDTPDQNLANQQDTVTTRVR